MGRSVEVGSAIEADDGDGVAVIENSKIILF